MPVSGNISRWYTLAEMEGEGALRVELADRDRRIAELEARTKTTLSGAQFLALVVIVPLLGAFVVLGVLIVWKTTNAPAEVAPHLDLILVAYAIFSNPVSAVVGAVVAGMTGAKKEEAA